MKKIDWIRHSMLILYNIALALVIYGVYVITRNVALMINTNIWFIPLIGISYFLSCLLVGIVVSVDVLSIKQKQNILGKEKT